MQSINYCTDTDYSIFSVLNTHESVSTYGEFFRKICYLQGVPPKMRLYIAAILLKF